MQFLIVFTGILTFLHSGNSEDTPPRVQTQYGIIEGINAYTDYGRRFFAFTNVRYAKAPIGELRFEPPEPPKPWKDVYRATKPLKKCMQISYMRLIKGKKEVVEGEEDCLFMNIYTPYIKTEGVVNEDYNRRILPVIVNFHGGGFMFGYGGDYDPKDLLERIDVVFVTVNYRLGPLGFLSTENVIIPGNMGLKDQVAALKWIQENIRLFNGDPSRVTLVGNSAGGASVHYHYLSYQSQNLFKNGVSLSGSALCPWALMEHGLDKALTLLDSVGCSISANGSLWDQIECLKKRPGRMILQKTRKLFFSRAKYFRVYYPFSPFGPVIERDSKAPFIDDNPYDIIRLGRAKDAPWLVSVVSHEGLYHISHILANDKNLIELQRSWVNQAPYLLDFNYTVIPKFKDQVSESILNEYLHRFADVLGGWKSILLDKISYKIGLIDIFSDRFYKASIAMAARMQANYYTSNVYFYEFTYRGDNSITEVLSGKTENYGVSHADDLTYLHGTKFQNVKFSPKDYDMKEKMIRMWINYIEYEKPLLGSNDSLWKPVCDQGSVLNYMQILSPSEFYMKENADFGKLNFWTTRNIDENLFFKFQRYYSYEYLEDWL